MTGTGAFQPIVAGSVKVGNPYPQQSFYDAGGPQVMGQPRPASSDL